MSDASIGGAHEKPTVEIHVAPSRMSAAAGAQRDTRLSDEQIAALQLTLANLVAGFRPPKEEPPDSGLRLNSIEIELGFKVETGSGSVLKLLLDASAEANITAKVAWGREK